MQLLNMNRDSALTLTKNHIIWSLFTLLVWFNYVDTVQTYRLLELRAQELNPFIIFLIGLGNGSFVYVIAYKIFVGIFMAAILFMYQKRCDQLQRSKAASMKLDANAKQYSHAA